MKSVLDWHALYDLLVRLVEGLDTAVGVRLHVVILLTGGHQDMPRSNILQEMPKAALLWRLSAIREIVLSGFQLELYAPEERPFAYWYAAQVLDAHLHSLEDLMPVVHEGT
jgi:hypothetical protein